MRKLFIGLLVCCVVLITFRDGYTECEGDINCSGVVDGSDLAAFAADFGTTGCGSCDDVIARMEELEVKLAVLEELLEHFTRVGNDIYIDGANLHVRNGTGSTKGDVNGLGNLIVGYNESRGEWGTDDRTGSHNIVTGSQHNYSSFGGLVAGHWNTISGPMASVSGGYSNEAIVSYASVAGGRNNIASGYYSFVAGGGGTSQIDGNEAFADFSAIVGGRGSIAGDPEWNHSIGEYSTVIGGVNNQTTGDGSLVSGGEGNVANAHKTSILGGKENTTTPYILDLNDEFAGAEYATVSGGVDNRAGAVGSSVSGGRNNSAYGSYSSITGGGADNSQYGNVAIGPYSSIHGGDDNETSATGSSILGGRRNMTVGTTSGAVSTISGGVDNSASGIGSSVSGGNNRPVTGTYDWRAGELTQDQ